MGEGMDLKQKLIAKLKSGIRWNYHQCSLCDYWCNYNSDGKNLFYDSGCYCVKYRNNSPRLWSDLDFNLEPSHGHIPSIEAFISSNGEK